MKPKILLSLIIAIAMISVASLFVCKTIERSQINRENQAITEAKEAGYDSTYYPEGMEDVPKPFAIVRANEHMIKTCDYLICYEAGLVGNTGKLVKKALRRQAKGEMHVENLADAPALTTHAIVRHSIGIAKRNT